MNRLMEKIAEGIRDRRVEPSQSYQDLRSQRLAVEIAIMKGFFTIKEASLYLGISTKSVANLKAQGIFDSLSKAGAGRKLITKKSLDRYIGVIK